MVNGILLYSTVLNESLLSTPVFLRPFTNVGYCITSIKTVFGIGLT